MELREIDIWKLESQEKIRKMSEEWALSILGKRAKRMQNAETNRGSANSAGGSASGPSGNAMD